jgi:hypothetical protein
MPVAEEARQFREHRVPPVSIGKQRFRTRQLPIDP